MGLNNSLLEELRERAGCSYLSDLISHINFAAVSQSIKDIPFDSYSEKEWLDAAAYISQGNIIAVSAMQSREFLIRLK